MASSQGSNLKSPRKRTKLENSKDEVQSDSDDESIDEEILQELEKSQNELDALSEQAAVEILNIERQYNKLRKPLYEQRAEFIAKVPTFWLRVLASHPTTKVIISKEEMECLHYMTKLEVEDSEDIESGYWIRFYFDKNPYFENDVLIKEFRLGNIEAVSTSSEVKWKDGMNLVDRSRDRIELAKNRGIKLPGSFFYWLVDHTDPLQDHVATVIKEDIWPSPLEYCAVYDEEDDENELDVISEGDEEEHEDSGKGDEVDSEGDA